MSAPQLTTPIFPIGYPNPATDGRYAIPDETPVQLRVKVTSSGNSIPMTKFVIDWGDGAMNSTDFRGINAQYDFMHSYLEPGAYDITVRTINSDEEEGAATGVPIFISQPTTIDSSGTPVKAGLATPGTTVRQSQSTVLTTYPPLLTKLAAAANEGEDQILVASYQQQFEPDSLVIITETGKFTTSGRVKEINSNVVTLFSTLNDSYTTNADVELRRNSLGRSVSQVTESPPELSPWYFPISRGIELIRAAIRTLLFTRKGERVMRPDVGSDLYKAPFEPNDAALSEFVRSEVLSVLAQVPEAALHSFRVERLEHDVRVRCVFQEVTTGDQFEINFGAAAP